MIKIENINVWGFEHAIRACRNPMDSWSKSDSFYGCEIDDYDAVDRKHHKSGYITKCDDCQWCEPLCYGELDKRKYIVGENDLDLMQRLYKSGVEHRTYARMLQVSMDITAPLYWWKEMDRYTVGKSQVSCSTMHTIHKKAFELDDFSHDHLTSGGLTCLNGIIERLNISRNFFEVLDGEEAKPYWWDMIQILPSSYNQRRTICMSYEVVFKIIRERTGHKLDEWRTMIEVLKDLPYVKEIVGE